MIPREGGNHLLWFVRSLRSFWKRAESTSYALDKWHILTFHPFVTSDNSVQAKQTNMFHQIYSDQGRSHLHWSGSATSYRPTARGHTMGDQVIVCPRLGTRRWLRLGLLPVLILSATALKKPIQNNIKRRLIKCVNTPQRIKHLLPDQIHSPLSSFPFRTVPSLNRKENLVKTIQHIAYTCCAGAWPLTPLTIPHAAAALRTGVLPSSSGARVRTGHGVDSERLTVRLRSARQNKHRRVRCDSLLHDGPETRRRTVLWLLTWDQTTSAGLWSRRRLSERAVSQEPVLQNSSPDCPEVEFSQWWLALWRRFSFKYRSTL